ncbi:serine hydrolase domain-containing protein [Haliangium ochraceum]|uniref:Beta-lactamase n=1 Tax=Haliangium ochraceum (strain DSM 14365 / JCM 11303 / SMP-2) TaxID=502025 RepID=D0LKR1_HALO1|nr:serine hydrolase domain-containing protein [Haliangium ochraceum]ACY16631.1 beta-lactamase [Haliangium ochraceum DSM 14365]
MRRSVLFALALALLASCAPTPRPQPQAPTEAPPPDDSADAANRDAAAEREARLATLAEQLEQQRQALHIVGMSVAIVDAEGVIWARGFGQRDLDSGAEVTPETLFAIGSTTKAFTSAAAAMVVDAGAMQWDDPLTQHMPEFKLQVRAEGERAATIRDALSHRTGFPRMSVLWAGNTLDWAGIARYASRAVPTADLGAEWQYNNVVYAAAGEASARAAQSTWHELVRERILQPLGMRTATLTSAEAERSGLLASGYSWREDLGRQKHEKLRDISTIAAAGSIHASAKDMANWVRFQLGKGTLDDARLVSAAALEETWSPQIEIADMGASYGMGWFLKTWEGQRFVEHGGNVDGFSASVGFLPDAGLGYVFLSNTSASLLQAEIGPRIFDALLGERDPGDADAEDLSPYVGKYIADFGPFSDARFEVRAEGGTLKVDIPGQGVMELRPPDAEGRRTLTISDAIAMSFSRDDQGQVTAMFVHQGGFDFELPREGVEPPMEVDIDEVARYLGRYKGEMGEVSVLVHRGRLSVDIQGQGKSALELPADGAGDADGPWPLRMRKEFYVVFQEDERGAITGFTAHLGDREIAHERVAGASADKPLTRAALDALRKPQRRARAIAAMGHARLEGRIRIPQAGVEGTVQIDFDGLDRYRSHIDLGEVGHMLVVVSPEGSWSDDSFFGVEVLEGARATQARTQHPLAMAGDWDAVFDSVTVRGSETEDGKAVHLVTLRAGELPPWRVQIDAATGEVLSAAGAELNSGHQVPVTLRYSDYRTVPGVRGLRVPFAIANSVAQSGDMALTIERVRTRLRAEPSLYPPTPPTPATP